MPEKITLDRGTFKALASNTRLAILKILGQRRHTQSELAVTLGLAVPSVKEHLQALEQANLVSVNDEGRKWKYYTLTTKGKAVLFPEQREFFIMLGVFTIIALGTILSWAKYFLARHRKHSLSD